MGFFAKFISDKQDESLKKIGLKNNYHNNLSYKLWITEPSPSSSLNNQFSRHYNQDSKYKFW